MQPILIVENSKIVTESLRALLTRDLKLEVISSSSLAEAKRAIRDTPEGFLAGIFGLFLKDGTNMEVVDFALEHGVPPVIFTGAMRPDVRLEMWQREIVDYVVKDSPQSLRQLVDLFRRLRNNASVTALVVARDATMREQAAGLLARHRFEALSAETGEEALPMLKASPSLRLLLMGDDLGGQGPMAFIDACRQERTHEELAIITMAAAQHTEIAIHSLKRGANDFLTWPCSAEEFYSRVNNSTRTLELFENLRTLSQTDFLTGIHNRAFFMKKVDMEFQRCVRYDRPLSVIMMDADRFKNINDTYGHAVGDLVLIKLAEVISGTLRTNDVFARYGGEEFVFALPETGLDEAASFAERMRGLIEESVIPTDKGELRFTLSFGVADRSSGNPCDSLDSLLQQADEALYRAKEQGRNRVCCHAPKQGPAPGPMPDTGNG